jgi:hypothetical protein
MKFEPATGWAERRPPWLLQYSWMVCRLYILAEESCQNRALAAYNLSGSNAEISQLQSSSTFCSTDPQCALGFSASDRGAWPVKINPRDQARMKTRGIRSLCLG